MELLFLLVHFPFICSVKNKKQTNQKSFHVKLNAAESHLPASTRGVYFKVNLLFSLASKGQSPSVLSSEPAANGLVIFPV